MLKRFIVLIALLIPGIARSQWTPCNKGFNGSEIHSILVLGSKIFVGTSNGVFRSTDNGVNWSGQNSGMDGNLVLALERCDSVILAATDSGIYRTSDEGSTWEYSGVGLPRNAIINSLLASSTYLFAGSLDSGIYRSSNGGKNWISSNDSLGSVSVWTLVAADTTIIATTSHGIVFSSNNGNSWTLVDSSTRARQLAVTNKSIFALDAGVLLRSSDLGRTWTQVSSGYYSNISGSGEHLFASVSFGFQKLGIIHSSNEGQTWQTLNDSIPLGYYAYPSLLRASGRFVFLGTNGQGLFWSNDGGSSWCSPWAVERGGLVCKSASEFLVNGSKIFLVGSPIGQAFYNHLFISSDSGLTWSRQIGANFPGEVSSLIFHDGYLFAGSSQGVFRSSDDGLNWTAINYGLASVEVNCLLDQGLYLIAGTTGDAYLDRQGGISISSDDGQSWSSRGPKYAKISALVGSGGNILGALYYAYSNGVFFLSSDSGLTWIEEQSDSLNYIATFLDVQGALFAGGGGGIARSTDHGQNWILVNVGLRPDSYGGLAMYSLATASSSSIFAGGYTGIFVSTNNGERWMPCGISTEIRSVATLGNQVFVGSYDNALFRRSISDVVSSLSVWTQAGSTQPLRCYPNPFFESTHIMFTTDEAGRAEVSICNILGMEIARLYSGRLEAGEHQFEWNRSSGLPDGVYRWCVNVNGERQTLPITLMR